MAKVILHSDDFGLHVNVNRAIMDAARAGGLTSCSLMANGPAVADAVSRLRQIGPAALGVGIHLNILRGSPLSDPETVPSLVDGNGLFFNSARKLALHAASGRVKASHIRKEFGRQVEYLLAQGITPTHVDSEKHTHLWLPQASAAVEEIMKQYHIEKVRTVRESAVYRYLKAMKIPLHSGPFQVMKRGVLEAATFKQHQRWSLFKTPHGFFGVAISGQYHLNSPASILKALCEMDDKIVVEWMFHLGYDDTETSQDLGNRYGIFFLDNQRQVETQWVIHEDFLKTARHYKNKLMAYDQL